PLRLILEELLVNIARHGYRDRAGRPIRLEFAVTEGAVRIVVEDEAPPFNPLADAPAPDLESDLENREPGGLGIFLVQSLADRAEYRRTGQGNRLELQKAIRV
ncbi:MAG TPA: ATP-binding protein, partial [Gammaproteobacteria bacterium]|nr:ATP-binding protein [Gammaproteobacteria bacterium]